MVALTGIVAVASRDIYPVDAFVFCSDVWGSPWLHFGVYLGRSLR